MLSREMLLVLPGAGGGGVKRTHIDQCCRPQVCWYAEQEQESYAGLVTKLLKTGVT